jgi:hypothetical protein
MPRLTLTPQGKVDGWGGAFVYAIKWGLQKDNVCGGYIIQRVLVEEAVGRTPGVVLAWYYEAWSVPKGVNTPMLVGIFGGKRLTAQQWANFADNGQVATGQAAVAMLPNSHDYFAYGGLDRTTTSGSVTFYADAMFVINELRTSKGVTNLEAVLRSIGFKKGDEPFAGDLLSKKANPRTHPETEARMQREVFETYCFDNIVSRVVVSAWSSLMSGGKSMVTIDVRQ